MNAIDIRDIKISAIVPNYNMADILKRSIQSLVDQTVPFTEIIIVDDASTDDSLAVISTLMEAYPNIKLVQHAANQGVLSALNSGISHAGGDYVMLCAADDHYGLKVIEKSKEVIRQFPGVGVICGDAVVERFDLEQPFYRTLPFLPGVMITPAAFKQQSQKGYVGFNGGGGMLMNRRAVNDAGMLQQDSRWHGDWILYFVAAFRQGVYYVDEIFTYINMRDASYSEGKRDQALQNQVMLATIRIIKEKYPDLWQDFRKAGLLPHYAFRYIRLFMMNADARSFITTRLLWKIFVNNAMVVRIGRLFPYRIILGMRKFLKA